MDMNKPFYKSMTFWGAAAWAVVSGLQQFSAINPEVGIVAQSIAAFLTAMGIRRAIQ